MTSCIHGERIRSVGGTSPLWRIATDCGSVWLRYSRSTSLSRNVYVPNRKRNHEVGDVSEMVVQGGIEPPTFSVSARRANHLCHWTIKMVGGNGNAPFPKTSRDSVLLLYEPPFMKEILFLDFQSILFFHQMILIATHPILCV